MGALVDYNRWRSTGFFFFFFCLCSYGKSISERSCDFVLLEVVGTTEGSVQVRYA